MENEILHLTLMENGVFGYFGLVDVGVLCLHLCLYHEYGTVRAVKIYLICTAALGVGE